MQAFIAPPMRRGRSTVVISICTPPFADRCIASLRCSRPTPGIFRPISISCCRPAGWTPSCAIPKRAAPSPISPAKVRRAKRHPELGKVMPFGANDLSLFAAADAAIRAWIADAPLPPRDKAPVDYFGRGEHHQARGEFTLNLAADVENFTALPAGYEIARRQRNVGWCRPGPLYPLSQRRGRHRPARRAVAPRRCPSSPATSLRKHHD